MKSYGFISVAALCAALVAGAGQAEAKMSTTKKVMIGAGVVAAVGGGALLMKKMSDRGKMSAESTGSIRPQKAVQPADEDDERPVRRPVKRGVDQTVTGSATKASYRETCAVKSVDLFDKKGHFVKAERMRVCQ
jgi:3-hydroxy-3-methylglutaryl CoA synthase